MWNRLFYHCKMKITSKLPLTTVRCAFAFQLIYFIHKPDAGCVNVILIVKITAIQTDDISRFLDTFQSALNRWMSHCHNAFNKNNDWYNIFFPLQNTPIYEFMFFCSQILVPIADIRIFFLSFNRLNFFYFTLRSKTKKNAEMLHTIGGVKVKAYTLAMRARF